MANNVSISLDELWPIIDEVISSGGEFELYPRGTSMLPLLRAGEDSVILVSPDNVCVNDMVLYKRDNGQFVLHRVISIKNGEYTMCGDNQYLLEKGLKEKNLLAKVKLFRRGSVDISPDNPEYLKYLRCLKNRRFKKRMLNYSIRFKNKIKRILKK